MNHEPPSTWEWFFWIGLACAGVATVCIIVSQRGLPPGVDFPFVSRDPKLISPAGVVWRNVGYLFIAAFFVLVAMAFGRMPTASGQ
ncbi:MAG: hypothetical protein ABS95_00330 [Verrucomicrobia bacterium SCN 57-15]|nr:MAG: hypothetical protein ABS95_00330 [Verrucomicrobia bacterium SCN 57-15]